MDFYHPCAAGHSYQGRTASKCEPQIQNLSRSILQVQVQPKHEVHAWFNSTRSIPTLPSAYLSSYVTVPLILVTVPSHVRLLSLRSFY